MRQTSTKRLTFKNSFFKLKFNLANRPHIPQIRNLSFVINTILVNSSRLIKNLFGFSMDNGVGREATVVSKKNCYRNSAPSRHWRSRINANSSWGKKKISLQYFSTSVIWISSSHSQKVHLLYFWQFFSLLLVCVYCWYTLDISWPTWRNKKTKFHY